MKKRRLCPQPIFDEPSLAKAFEKHAVKLVHIKNVWRECCARFSPRQLRCMGSS